MYNDLKNGLLFNGDLCGVCLCVEGKLCDFVDC